LPEDVSRNLKNFSDWPETVESIDTLSHF